MNGFMILSKLRGLSLRSHCQQTTHLKLSVLGPQVLVAVRRSRTHEAGNHRARGPGHGRG